MKEHKLTGAQMTDFERFLRSEEQSCGTREKYGRDLRAFARWLDGRSVAKGAVAEWKEHLAASGYAALVPLVMFCFTAHATAS